MDTTFRNKAPAVYFDFIIRLNTTEYEKDSLSYQICIQKPVKHLRMSFFFPENS